jgi:hypothetical protein
MWVLTVVGALLARAHLQDLVAGVPSDLLRLRRIKMETT